MEGGGSERQLLNLMRGLDRGRFDPSLYVLYRRGALLQDVPADVPIEDFWTRHTAPRWNWPGRVHRWQNADVRRAILRGNIDLVYDRLFHMSMITGNAVRGTPAARVSTIVSPPSRDLRNSERYFFWIKRWLLRQSYRSADRLLAVSQATAEDAAQFYAIDRQKIEVVMSPIDVERIEQLQLQPLETPEPLDGSLGIIAIGRLSYLLQSFAMLVKSMNRRLHLHLVGDGPDRESLQFLASELGIESLVTFHGFRANPYSLLARMDLLVLPSLYEGLPNVLLEGMICGVPVVATEASGSVRDLLQRSMDVSVVPAAQVEPLCLAMQNALEDRQPWRARLAKGREYVLAHHGMKPWLNRMQTLFEQAIEEKRGR